MFEISEMFNGRRLEYIREWAKAEKLVEGWVTTVPQADTKEKNAPFS